MSITVRCKFECFEVGKVRGWGKHKVLYRAKLQPVTGGAGNAENDSFFASTPSGSIEVAAVRDDLFEVGQTYYVDFTPAE